MVYELIYQRVDHLLYKSEGKREIIPIAPTGTWSDGFDLLYVE